MIPVSPTFTGLAVMISFPQTGGAIFAASAITLPAFSGSFLLQANNTTVKSPNITCFILLHFYWLIIELPFLYHLHFLRQASSALLSLFLPWYKRDIPVATLQPGKLWNAYLQEK